MDLKDALLCIDCDTVFTVGGSRCNPRCPKCASSIFAPLSAWIQTLTAFEQGAVEGERMTHDDMAEPGRRMALVHSTSIAA